MSKETEIKKDENDSNVDENTTLENENTWLIRDCEVYKDEYGECTGFRARFHQYFIHGETLDCNQWKKDYNNCCKWISSKDLKAANSVIESEKDRRMTRLKGHYGNNTWKRRPAPPENWNTPLPEWMVKRDENTYLAIKARELLEGKEEEKSSSCCIM